MDDLRERMQGAERSMVMDLIERELRRHQQGGAVGVWFLMRAALWTHHRDLDAHSASKCQFVVSELLSTARAPDGKPIASDERRLRESCAKYKNSAHMWGALEWLSIGNPNPAAPTAESIETRIEKLLVRADRLAQAGLEAGLIEHWNPWRLPPSFPRPDDPARIPRPPRAAMDALTRYRSGASRR